MSRESDLPPGCSASDIPGNTPEDEAWDKLIEHIGNAGLSAAEARARWDSQPDLLATLKNTMRVLSSASLDGHKLTVTLSNEISAAMELNRVSILKAEAKS